MKKIEKQYRPIALDLFAGCGGFSLGAEAAGFNIAASIEIDPIHALTHHFNFPYGATICKDVRNVSQSLIKEKLRINDFDTEIDLIIGGSPCQGFSLMGKRDDHDIRNQLIYEYARIVNEFKPKYFLFENVPGIISGDTKRVFEDFLKQFPDYRLEWKILSGVQFNLPQNRKRVIALGSRKDAPLVSLPQGNPFDKYLRKQTTSKGAIRDLALVNTYLGKDEGIALEEILRVRTKASSEYLLFLDKFFELCHLRHGKKLIWGHVMANHSPQVQSRFATTEPGRIEGVSRFFKLDPNKCSNTLRAGTDLLRGSHTAPRPIHYQHPRCISVREGARLHSYPDWFQFHRSIFHGFRQIGNSVMPLFAKAICDRIMDGLNPDLYNLSPVTLDNCPETVLTHSPKNALKAVETLNF